MPKFGECATQMHHFLNGVTEHSGGKNGKNFYLSHFFDLLKIYTRTCAQKVHVSCTVYIYILIHIYVCMYVSCQNWHVYSCLFVTILMKDNRHTVMLTLFATTTHIPSSQTKNIYLKTNNKPTSI